MVQTISHRRRLSTTRGPRRGSIVDKPRFSSPGENHEQSTHTPTQHFSRHLSSAQLIDSNKQKWLINRKWRSVNIIVIYISKPVNTPVHKKGKATNRGLSRPPFSPQAFETPPPATPPIPRPMRAGRRLGDDSPTGRLKPFADSLQARPDGRGSASTSPPVRARPAVATRRCSHDAVPRRGFRRHPPCA